MIIKNGDLQLTHYKPNFLQNFIHSLGIIFCIYSLKSNCDVKGHATKFKTNLKSSEM